MINTICTMRRALSDVAFFGSQLSGPSWLKWRALLLAICGEKLNESELGDFKMLTNRATAPTEPVREFWGAGIGRRGGKSRAMAVLAAYLAPCKDYRAILAPKERGQLQVIAASMDQANLVLNFIAGVFDASEALRGFSGLDRPIRCGLHPVLTLLSNQRATARCDVHCGHSG